MAKIPPKLLASFESVDDSELESHRGKSSRAALAAEEIAEARRLALLQYHLEQEKVADQQAQREVRAAAVLQAAKRAKDARAERKQQRRDNKAKVSAMHESARLARDHAREQSQAKAAAKGEAMLARARGYVVKEELAEPREGREARAAREIAEARRAVRLSSRSLEDQKEVPREQLKGAGSNHLAEQTQQAAAMRGRDTQNERAWEAERLAKRQAGVRSKIAAKGEQFRGQAGGRGSSPHSSYRAGASELAIVDHVRELAQATTHQSVSRAVQMNEAKEEVRAAGRIQAAKRGKDARAQRKRLLGDENAPFPEMAAPFPALLCR